jgi:hypothetical protein
MRQDIQTLPPFSRIGSRSFRRRLVAATYGAWLLIVLSSTLITVSNPEFPVYLPALIANAMVLIVLFGRRTYLSREVLTGDTGLDERLVQNRNQAFRRAFQVLAMVVLVAWPASLAVTKMEPGLEGLWHAGLIYFGVATLVATLPTAAWLWREPDPLTSTEEAS